eukprot:231704_1
MYPNAGQPQQPIQHAPPPYQQPPMQHPPMQQPPMQQQMGYQPQQQMMPQQQQMVVHQPQMVPQQMAAQPQTVGQSVQANAAKPNGTHWKSGLFQFDIGQFCFACCCPTCAAGEVIARKDNINCCISCCVVTCLQSFGLTWYRKEVREADGIEGSLLEDLAVSCFCPYCVITQMDNQVPR